MSISSQYFSFLIISNRFQLKIHMRFFVIQENEVTKVGDVYTMT